MCKITVSAYQLMKRFPDEESARLYLEKKRWNGKPKCPHCGDNEVQSKQKRNGKEGYYFCFRCKETYTVRVNSVFGRSHIPLDKWLFAIYHVVTDRKGISSLALSKIIGVTQKTSWFMLQRIREACRTEDLGAILGGDVEADGGYFGGIEGNKHESKKRKEGRGTVGKIPVLGIRERGGKFRGKVVSDTSKETIQGELEKTIRDGANLYTDEHKAYTDNKYNHKIVKHSAKQYVDGMASTNSVESVWAVLKRGFYGVWHSFSKKHLQRYVDECAFRLNEGKVDNHTLSRIDYLVGKTFGKRITYAQLTA